MRRVLALDIGGVFYLSKADAEFFTRWSSRCGLDAAALTAGLWHGPDIEMANIGLIETEDYCARAADRLGLGADLVGEMIRDAFVGDFNHALADYVREARARGVPVCALTNSWSSATQLMARPELAGLFDFVISSHDAGVAKPDEAIYRRLLRRLGRPAADIVFVDDTPACVEAASGLGLLAFRFQDTAQAVAALERLLT